MVRTGTRLLSCVCTDLSYTTVYNMHDECILFVDFRVGVDKSFGVWMRGGRVASTNSLDVRRPPIDVVCKPTTTW